MIVPKAFRYRGLRNSAVLGVAVAALALFASAATAANLSNVRCENSNFINYMSTRLPKLKSAANGRQLSQTIAVHDITRSRTVSSTKDKLVCEISVKLSVPGANRTVMGRFTTQQFPGGRVSWKWLPAY
jgi:hypothetical protein